jgi:hypothetical protein
MTTNHTPVTLLSMSQILFGEHAIEDALTTHGDLFVLLCIYHTPPFFSCLVACLKHAATVSQTLV